MEFAPGGVVLSQQKTGMITGRMAGALLAGQADTLDVT
jgi:hypothetical protein